MKLGEIMNILLYYFLLFMIFSIVGWIVEVLFVFIIERKWSNRGFLIGYYLPIYGSAALFMNIFLIDLKNQFLLLFLISAIAVTLIEYFTSLIMEKIYKARWWDYSTKFLNFQGRICIEHTLLFGILGIIFIYFINDGLIHLVSKINTSTINTISSILLVIFITDLIISLNVMNKIKVTATNLKKDYTDEINEKVKDFLLNHSFFTKRIIKSFPNIKIIIKGQIDKINKRTSK